MAVILFYILTLYAAHIAGDELERPNIVVVVGDDIGWDDISLHGSDQIQTPNIDMIGYQGVIIPNYYTNCRGTASGSAFFTGKYPMKMGTQGPSIGAGEDRGIPSSERLLPSYLKDLGYDTHLVGKWSLGKSRKHYLPTNRGFDNFYGFIGESVDYFSYDQVETWNGTEYFGFGLFDNFEPARDQHGHLTNILTKHAVKIIEEHNTSVPLYLHLAHAAAHTGALVNLQAPEEDVSVNRHIAHSARRLYAALVTGVDKSVGNIVAALAGKGILNNTIIVFVSDNGASSIGVSRNYGSNLPLRGTKGTPWEGALRSTAVLWHANINPTVWKGLFHVTDWLPTLIAAAGGNRTKHNIDGKNQWESIVMDEIKEREEGVVLAVDDMNEWGAYRNGDFKIVVGSVPNTCGYYGQDLNKVIYDPPVYQEALLNCQTSKAFTESLEIGLDITYAMEIRDSCNLNKLKNESNDTAAETLEFCVPTKDPEESQDLWDQYPDIVTVMSVRFRLFWSELVPTRPTTFDLRADPALHGYTWKMALMSDDAKPPTHKPADKPAPPFPMQMSVGELQYYLQINLEQLNDRIHQYMKVLSESFVGSVSYLVGPM